MKTSFLFIPFFIATLALAQGYPGKPGLPVITHADGNPQSFDASGGRGGDGRDGRNGYPPSCYSTGGQGNVVQPAGEDGEDGESGGQGGDGGDITVYYQTISDIQKIYVNGSPGAGGYGGSGGYGSQGCNCAQSFWTYTDPQGNTETFSCTSGRDGYNGRPGSRGANGNWGRIFLIQGSEEVKPSMPAVYLDMAKMEVAPIVLSKNNWETKTGARSLFRQGSYTGDTYRNYLGRDEVKVTFKWAASRPLSGFAGMHMYVYLEGDTVKINYPNNLLTDIEVIPNGNERTIVFHSALSTGEVANLGLQNLVNYGENLKIGIKDYAKVSDVVDSEITLRYATYENGQYKDRFKGVVPETALSVSAAGVDILIGKLGIDAAYVKSGLNTYIGITVKRTYGSKSYQVNFSNYFQIPLFSVGTPVEVLVDANLLTGTTVVGKILKGEQYLVAEIQNPWIKLKKLDGTAVNGWVQFDKLKPL